jgi:hypothetical protein
MQQIELKLKPLLIILSIRRLNLQIVKINDIIGSERGYLSLPIFLFGQLLLTLYYKSLKLIDRYGEKGENTNVV